MLYITNMPPKHLAAFRLSPDALRLLKQLAKRLGLSQAGILELAIRNLARKEKAL